MSSVVKLQVSWRPRLPGPMGAAVCGALVSGGLTLSTGPLLHLALLLFLVEIAWGALWSGLLATDWATYLREWRHWERFLPFASSEGPAGRLARNLAHLRSWWAESLGPARGTTLTGLALLLPAALVIAAVLGVRPLLVTLAAISLVQFFFAWTGGDARPLPGPQAAYEIALPWLAGHVLYAELTPLSLALALTFTLAYAGGLRLAQGWTGLARWNLGIALAVVALVVARHSMTAGIVGVLMFGQAVAQPTLFTESEEIDPQAAARFVRVGQLWLMAAMLMAAWGAQAG